ncbi:acyl-CoA mutase large subunit family protein [Ruficoccus amylovorans]|uniref:Acyl-CoA mutase large subunit family protein n=1 Tax=Ruficoccus amylovorans TaxID=1804625 RepID=A0A842H9N8_9BACT|nr:methylmalonyl-CoA mutase family protein [Ruficoccus amylovorans]MBC2592995.1 acyl-CoA mutase large subunit family protein [Ruficoccus amylovorans]
MSNTDTTTSSVGDQKALNLLEEFAPVDYATWKEAAEKLLKGAPFDKKMLTPTPEGITLQPIYRQEDMEGLEHLESFPGEFNFSRGATDEGYLKNAWKIAQELPYGLPEEFNAAALSDMQRGQDALNVALDIAGQTGRDPAEAGVGEVGACGLSVATLEDLQKAFKDVVPEAVNINFQSGVSGVAVAALLVAWLKEQGKEAKSLKGGLNLDPLGVLARSGSLPVSLDEAFADMAALASYCKDNAPEFTPVGVSTLPYANAGASAVEELACALATGTVYLRKLMEAGLDINEAAKAIRFEFTLGANFFMEVSKLRAARILWSKIVSEFGGDRQAARMQIHGRTGLWNKTVHDPYVNMLRTTTEALSGVVGGVESMHVSPFDEVIETPTTFSRRIARNTQIILQEECELRAVIDPAGGSWFIENLTDQVAKGAWGIFQEIEKEGCMVAALQSGSVQARIAKTNAGRIKLLTQRRANLVGTNLYPNLKEKPLPKTTPDFSEVKKQRVEAVKAAAKDVDLSTLADRDDGLIDRLAAAASQGATLGAIFKALHTEPGEVPSVTALPSVRGAQIFEEMRDAADAYTQAKGHGPKMFLTTMGPLRKHKARADFTRGFFEVGGFDIVAADGFDSVEAAVAGVKASGSELTVICGTDDAYVEFVPAFCKALKAEAPGIKIILAGDPGENGPAYTEAGLDDFISIRSNVYDINKKYLEAIGVM